MPSRSCRVEIAGVIEIWKCLLECQDWSPTRFLFANWSPCILWQAVFGGAFTGYFVEHIFVKFTWKGKGLHLTRAEDFNIEHCVRACGLNFLVVCFNVKTYDIWEEYVTIRSEIQTENIRFPRGSISFCWTRKEKHNKYRKQVRSAINEVDMIEFRIITSIASTDYSFPFSLLLYQQMRTEICPFFHSRELAWCCLVQLLQNCIEVMTILPQCMEAQSTKTKFA